MDNKLLYSSKHARAGIVFCGEYGEIYRRVHWNNRGCKSIVWKRHRIIDMTDFLKSQTGVIKQYDDKMVRRLVERVTVFGNKITAGFKSGGEIHVPR